jgi:hypothetical protein
MTVTRDEFDQLWSIHEETDPDMITRTCNVSVAEMEADFEGSMTYDDLAPYYLMSQALEREEG